MLKSTWSNCVKDTLPVPVGTEGGNLKQTLRSSDTYPQKINPVKTEMLKLTDEWELMNELQDAFNEIVVVKFFIDQLKEQVDVKDIDGMTNTINALEHFYPVYCNYYDKKFLKAWDHFVKHPAVNKATNS